MDEQNELDTSAFNLTANDKSPSHSISHRRSFHGATQTGSNVPIETCGSFQDSARSISADGFEAGNNKLSQSKKMSDIGITLDFNEPQNVKLIS